jgi:hypothetical protein
VYCSIFGGHGFNDILVGLSKLINYCIKTNRTLLFDTTRSPYKINWSDYFTIQTGCNVICDIEKIKILITDNLTIYPKYLNCKMKNILKSPSQVFTFKPFIGWYYKLDDNNYNLLTFPKENPSEDVIVIIHHKGGDGFEIFKSLSLSDNIKTHCKDKYSLIPKPYLGIQIRNTDIKCNYVAMYESNKELIHSYQTIYVSTDCVEALKFFNTLCINSTVFNFTTFDENICNKNLHYSNIDGDIKIKDLLCDIYMITMCDKFLTNSKGGFVNLLKECHKNELVQRMFLDI